MPADIDRRSLAAAALMALAAGTPVAAEGQPKADPAAKSIPQNTGNAAKMKTVYLAGPMVFLPSPEKTFSEMKEILRRHNLKGVAPTDNQLNLEGVPPGEALSRKIYQADVSLMDRLDSAIFNIDPFRRGTEMDPGTAFEVGYCRALRRPMTGWTTDPRSYPDKVRAFMRDVFKEDLQVAGSNSEGATSGALRDPDGILVHSDGMYQNLMIQEAILTSGGVIGADHDWRTAFEVAARGLAAILKS